jgi:hypothetical protein
VADDPAAPSEATPDPAADSPAGDSTEDSAQDSRTPQQPVDNADERVRNAQAALSRKAQEAADLRRERDELLALMNQDDEDDGEEGDEPAPTRRSTPSAALEAERARADAAEWTLAEAVYGPEVIAAYEASIELFNQATSATDYVTALEAYHELRSKGASPAAAAAAAEGGTLRTRAEEVQPRVDLNRPDAAPDSDQIDLERYEAGANGGVGGFIRAVLGRSQQPS